MHLLLLGLPALLGAPVAVVDASPLKATEMAVCRDIVDRGCDSEGRTFGPDVESVAFLTKVEGATGEAFVFHVWSFEGKEVKRVRLPIRAVALQDLVAEEGEGPARPLEGRGPRPDRPLPRCRRLHRPAAKID